VRAVLENPRLAQRLVDGARETVDRLYSWDVVGRELIERYLTTAHACSRDIAPAIRIGEHPRYGHS